MKKVIVLNKKEGETPLEVLENFREKRKEYKGVPMTYAGRLDPMASGILIVLAGEETKKKERYLNLDKEYFFEVLFGFATDTYDILGKVVKQSDGNIDKEEIRKIIKKFIGKQVQKYPIYSSRTVKGKPLFTYARSGEEVEVPEREIDIKKLNLIKTKKISGKKLLENIKKRIEKVNGDFRQSEILKIWNKELEKRDNYYLISGFKVKCSSGTYVRVLANSLGKELNEAGLAYSIKRTKIGKFVLPGSEF